MSARYAMLTVRADGRVLRIAVARDRSVREALDETDLRVRAACGGTGSCGACAVRLAAGEVSRPTVAELTRLTPAERAEGVRLACQVRVAGDAEVLLDRPAPASPWRSIPPAELGSPAERRPEPTRHVYGVAVDLGTTRIRASLWDRRRGVRVAAREGPNPQGDLGADVLNRLAAARERPARARELAALAREAILDALRDMLARDVGEVAPLLAEVGRLLVVGNTAMLALLTGRGGEALLSPEHWQRAIDCGPAEPDAWRAAWGLPNAEVQVAPPVGGFVGSDLVADLVATGLAEGPGPALLLDLGTNTELALWDGRALHATSVPGGPAFEAAGVSRGMPAAEGAIARVRRREGGGFDCEVLGGGEPRGFCGTGLVDAVAALRATGALRASGRFAEAPGPGGLELWPGRPRTSIAAGDVDAIQRAKAATAAGVEVLLARAGLRLGDLSRLCVCGALGRGLCVGSAQAIGLLPPVAPERVELRGGAALEGCERALLAAGGAALLSAAAERLRFVNLAFVPEYEERFVENLPLRPVPAE